MLGKVLFGLVRVDLFGLSRYKKHHWSVDCIALMGTLFRVKVLYYVFACDVKSQWKSLAFALSKNRKIFYHEPTRLGLVCEKVW